MKLRDIFLLFEQPSTYAADVDALFFAFTGVSAVAMVAIFLAGLYFCIRYRKGSPAARTAGPVARRLGDSHVLEYAWYTVPLILFLAGFFWAAHLYARLYEPPAGAMDIYVVAKQWMWKLQHPTGQREIDQLHVPRGIPIRLIMTSEDVIHSFYLPAFRIKRDVLPGRYLSTWFQAEKNGTYRLLCAEYCGPHHSHMRGQVIVMDPADYERWLQRQPSHGSLAEQGAAKFREYGCSGCHSPGSTVHAPDLRNLFGRPVPLVTGEFVIADEKYIRDSILQPRRHVVAGYPPIMPSFEGQISEGDMLKLIAYLKVRGTQAGETDREVPSRER